LLQSALIHFKVIYIFYFYYEKNTQPLMLKNQQIKIFLSFNYQQLMSILQVIYQLGFDIMNESIMKDPIFYFYSKRKYCNVKIIIIIFIK
jgi:hypothetical protein